MSGKLSEVDKCIRFLAVNGWKFDADASDEHWTYHKSGCYSVDINPDEFVFIDDSGDFLHEKTNYYALLGALIHNRQLSINYREYSEYKIEIRRKCKCQKD